MKNYSVVELGKMDEYQNLLADSFEYEDLKKDLEKNKKQNKSIASSALMSLLEMSLGHPDYALPDKGKLAAFKYLLDYGHETNLIDWAYNEDSGNVFDLAFNLTLNDDAKNILIAFLLQKNTKTIDELKQLFDKFNVDFDANQETINIYLNKENIEKAIKPSTSVATNNKI